MNELGYLMILLNHKNDQMTQFYDLNIIINHFDVKLINIYCDLVVTVHFSEIIHYLFYG